MDKTISFICVGCGKEFNRSKVMGSIKLTYCIPCFQRVFNNDYKKYYKMADPEPEQIPMEEDRKKDRRKWWLIVLICLLTASFMAILIGLTVSIVLAENKTIPTILMLMFSLGVFLLAGKKNNDFVNPEDNHFRKKV